jgi:hypothetical protein
VSRDFGEPKRVEDRSSDGRVNHMGEPVRADPHGQVLIVRSDHDPLRGGNGARKVT